MYMELCLGNQAAESEIQNLNWIEHTYYSRRQTSGTTNIPDKGHSSYPAMEHIVVITVPGVVKLLQSINPKKAIRPDLVPSSILKDYAEILGPVLKNIFQQSWDTPRWSTRWLDKG